MKKRFLVLVITCIFLLGSMLSACQKLPTGDYVSQAMTDKEIVMQSLNSVESDVSAFEAYNILGTLKYTDIGENVLGAEIDVDMSGREYDGDIKVTAGTDIMNLDICGDEEALFVLFKDIFESHIVFPLAEESIDPGQGVYEGELISVEANEKINAITAKLQELLGSDKLDSLFITAPESNDNTRVATLAVTDEDISELCGEIAEISGCDINIMITASKSNVNAMLDDIDADVKFEISGKTVEYIMDVQCADGNIIGALDVTVDGKTVQTIDISKETIDGKANYAAEAVIQQSDDAETLGYSSDTVIGFTYTENEAGKTGSGEIYIIQNTTVDETESVMNFSVPFECKAEEDGSYSFKADSFDVTDGVKVSIDIDLTVNLKKLENGYKLKADFVSDVEMLGADISLDLTISELEKFEYTEPTDAATVEDDWLAEIGSVYPDIYDMLFGIDDGGTSDSSIFIDNITDSYVFFSDGKGCYYVDLWYLESSEDGNLLLNTPNGKLPQFEYTVEDDILTIDGKTYKLSKLNDGTSDYYMIASEEITTIEGVKTSAVTIYYYPTLNRGYTEAIFDYTNDGGVYTITHFDGTTEEKTVLFDEEASEYYFEGTLPPHKRYIDVADGENSYSFDLQSGLCMFSSTEYRIDSYGSGEALIIAPDGEEIAVNYTEAVYNEETEEFDLEIDGMPFSAYETYGYAWDEEKGDWVENTDERTIIIWGYITCDCTAHYNELYVSVEFSPDTGYMYILTSMHFEYDGDTYTITRPDGTVVEKTVLFDEENEEYYFGE